MVTQRLLDTSDRSLGRESDGMQVSLCVCVVLGRVAVGAERQRESGPVQGQNPQGPFACFQQTFTVGRSSSSEGP